MKIEDEIQSKFRNEKHKAMVNLQFTQLAISNKLGEVFKRSNISAQQYNVLRILRGQYPNSASIGLIKDRMLDKNSDVSRIIDRLKRKKLLERKECKLDRRQKDVTISDEGLKLLETLDQDLSSIEKVIANVSDEDAIKLNSILDEIRQSL
ncbi:MarR family transcriptional regulator [Flavobacteriales bacterium]|nr:MarR family transcriptional regulator [Flavobacteriales bacterium]